MSCKEEVADSDIRVSKQTYRHLVSNFLEVNAPHQIHFAAVNLEDVKSRPLVGVGELNLPVNPAWSEQSCI